MSTAGAKRRASDSFRLGWKLMGTSPSIILKLRLQKEKKIPVKLNKIIVWVLSFYFLNSIFIGGA